MENAARGLLRAPHLHLGYSRSLMTFHLLSIRVLQCLQHFIVMQEPRFRKAPSQRIRLQELDKIKGVLKVQIYKAKCAKKEFNHRWCFDMCGKS